MINKITIFGASNHKNSINQRFAQWVGSHFESHEKNVLNLNDYEMAIYSPEREAQTGIPQEALSFYQILGESDLIIVSFAEYNGSYTTAFKNIIDWTSRIDRKLFQGKKCIFLATSTSALGGQDVLQQAVKRFSLMGADIIGHYWLPSFNHFFDNTTGITDADAMIRFKEFMSQIHI